MGNTWILWFVSLTVVSHGYMPILQPFFFMCNYHGNTNNLGIDDGEVTVSVNIGGDPEYYVPGQFYNGRNYLYYL